MQKLIIANWKANKTLSEVAHWLNNFPSDQESRMQLASLQIVIAPPYPFLGLARQIIDERQLPLQLAVQDLSAFGSGAYTGEVAAFNLQGLGVTHALLGHSERRRLLAESDPLIADKVAETLRSGIKPVLCLDQPNFTSQAKYLTSEQMNKLIIAYEPVAAIGSGQAEEPGDLLAVRQELQHAYGYTQLIYGGSVTADNIGGFLKVCDGVLVGGSSLDLQDFIDLLYQANSALVV
jgi:triosephosphate isomerase